MFVVLKCPGGKEPLGGNLNLGEKKRGNKVGGVTMKWSCFSVYKQIQLRSEPLGADIHTKSREREKKLRKIQHNNNLNDICKGFKLFNQGYELRILHQYFNNSKQRRRKSIAFKSLEAEICHPKWIEVGKATNCDNFFCHKILSEKFA